MSTSPALPGLRPGRLPYGTTPGRLVPIVPHVLIIGDRRQHYGPPQLIRAETVYETPTTVRVKLPDGKQDTHTQHKVYAIPDDAAWAEVEAALQAFAARLADLANVLRRQGRYKDRLKTAGGHKDATNPICPSVARIDDPDKKVYSTWWMSPWHVPKLERAPVMRHTQKMLSSGAIGAYVFSQDDCFVLVDDTAWEAVEAAHKDAEAAATAMTGLLNKLGTYQEALADGRHAARIAAAPAAASADPALPALTGELAGWAWQSQRARATRTGSLEPHYWLEAPGGTWRTGMHTEPKNALAEARRHQPAPVVEEKALAVVEPPVASYLVMDEAEARRAADAIKVAVEDLRVKIDAFDQGLGWKALGYESFRAWAAAEIPDTSLRHVYRLRDANEVDRSLGLPAGTTPEAHARELKPVPAPQRPDVLKEADARAADAGRERTAADVRAAAHAVTNGHTPGALSPRLADVAEQLRRGDWKEAYARARMTGEDYPRAIAAVDALVEGRPLDEALALLSGQPAPAEVITVQTKGGPREAPVLRRTGALALTPAWYAPDAKAPPALSDRHWTVTHVPTGYMVGRLIADRAEADRLFGQAAALDWSPVPPGGAVPVPLAEEIARIFGLSFPADEAYQRAAARAQARDHTLMRTSRGAVSGAPYTLWGQERGQRETFERWADVLARLDALERPAETTAPAFDFTTWSQRAAAVGANLKAYGLDYELVARGQVKGPRFPDGEEAALIAAIEALEAGAPAPPPPAPLDDDASPEADGWAYGHDAAGEVVVSIDRGALAPAVAEGIAAAAAALRALALGEGVDADDLYALTDTLGAHLEWAGAATLMAVLEEIASDAEALASKEAPQ